jgi:aspartate/methionine/tyrosine aminotransferase
VAGSLDAVDVMRTAFNRRRGTMHGMLNEIDGISCREPQGAFYAFPNMNGLLGRKLGRSTARTTMELGALLLEEVNVAIVPGEAFGAPGYARFSFALSDDDLVEGISRIADLVTRS